MTLLEEVPSRVVPFSTPPPMMEYHKHVPERRQPIPSYKDMCHWAVVETSSRGELFNERAKPEVVLPGNPEADTHWMQVRMDDGLSCPNWLSPREVCVWTPAQDAMRLLTAAGFSPALVWQVTQDADEQPQLEAQEARFAARQVAPPPLPLFTDPCVEPRLQWEESAHWDQPVEPAAAFRDWRPQSMARTAMVCRCTWHPLSRSAPFLPKEGCLWMDFSAILMWWPGTTNGMPVKEQHN